MGTPSSDAPLRPPTGRGAAGSPWRVAVPVMALAAGALFGTSAALARSSGVDQQPSDLAELIEQRAAVVTRLTGETERLRAEIEIEGDRAGSPAEGDGPVDETERLGPLIGTAPVAGLGLRVSLDDAGYTQDTIPEGYTPDDVVVHQQDVQGVVNALWAGGAEAMMVQDQRIVATSAVRCVGNTLYLQGRVYSPPYVITAIGDPDALAAALAEDDIVATYRSWSEVLGLGYLVEAVETVEMPAFTAIERAEYVDILDD